MSIKIILVHKLFLYRLHYENQLTWLAITNELFCKYGWNKLYVDIIRTLKYNQINQSENLYHHHHPNHTHTRARKIYVFEVTKFSVLSLLCRDYN